MRKKDFIELVQKELDHLRVHATQEEKNKLDFDSFEHTDGEACIYGQMTGDCTSERARELYPKMFGRVSEDYYSSYDAFPKQKFNKGGNYTPLEKYLYMVSNKDGSKSKKHAQLIDYIKGNLETIKL